MSIPKPFFEVFIVIILLSSLYYFLKIVNLSSDIIILNLAIFAVSIFRIYPSIYRIASCFQKGNYGRAVLYDLNNLFQKKNLKKKEDKKSFFTLPKKIKSLTLKDINFKYDNKDQLTLKNINLKLEQNKFVGIKGETGAGKSTLVDIISGLLRPDSGTFIIDGEIQKKLPEIWHNNISYVPQNISLIDDTLERNIALAILDGEIDKQRISEVIKLSKLEKFLNSDRNKDILGERGLSVSGGEKQRIGIARALYYDRPIYIFDEATNALDESTEKEILNNLKLYLKNKIVVFISHKKSTLDCCDIVLSFSEGKLS